MAGTIQNAPNLPLDAYREGERHHETHSIAAVDDAVALAKARQLYTQSVKHRYAPVLERFCLYREDGSLVREIRTRDLQYLP